jgi:hypothetical protein
MWNLGTNSVITMQGKYEKISIEWPGAGPAWCRGFQPAVLNSKKWTLTDLPREVAVF